ILHTEHDIIPSGTIAQLGERAIEVRKVAAQLGERAIEVRKVAGSIPARPITFLHFYFSLLPGSIMHEVGTTLARIIQN
ncbi:hypothetical protein N7465_011694, partial [Penicillium sp. CMV-2018d]